MRDANEWGLTAAITESKAQCDGIRANGSRGQKRVIWLHALYEGFAGVGNSSQSYTCLQLYWQKKKKEGNVNINQLFSRHPVLGTWNVAS